MKRILIYSLFFLAFSEAFNYTATAQKYGQQKIDSLLLVLDKHKADDTNRVKTLALISFEYYRSNPPKGILFAKQGINIAKKLNYSNGIADCYRSMGINYAVESNYDKALECFFISYKIFEETSNKRGIAVMLGPIGTIYKNQKNFPKALEYYFKALKFNEELNNDKDICANYGNIANVYNILGNFSKALDYYNRALKIVEKSGDRSSIATILGNIGSLYTNLSDYERALEFHLRALKINEELQNKTSTMFNLGSIGIVYLNQVTDSSYILNKYNNKMSKTLEISSLRKSVKYLLEAIEIAKIINANNELIDWYSILAKSYSKLKEWDKAYSYSQLSLELNKSVFSKQSQNKIQSLEHQQESALKDKEIKINKLELERQQLINIFIVIALILITLLAIFIYSRFRIKKKSNEILETKNKLISDQNNEITIQKEKIDLSYRNIKMLSDIGQAITANLSAETITETVYNNVSNLMNSTVFGIGLYNPSLQRLEFNGGIELDEKLPFFYFDLSDENRLAVYCFNAQKEIIISDYLKDCTKYIKEVPQPKAGKNSESLLYMPLNHKNKRIGVITVQSFEKNAYTEYHLDILRNLSIYVAIALDNAAAYQQIEIQNADIEAKISVVEQQSQEISLKNYQLVELNESKDKYLNKLNSELELAYKYVKSLIPAPITVAPIQTYWIYEPSSQIGGDSFGYHWVDDDHFAMYLFDVSGHGIGAALHSVSILNNIKYQTLPNADFLSPKDVLTKLNTIYKMKHHNNLFFTIWYGVFNIKTRVMTYSSAGHPAALYIQGQKSTLQLICNNPLIGAFNHYDYLQREILIDNEALIYIYSDGVFEIIRPDGTIWEQRDLNDFLAEHFVKSTRSDIERLYKHVKTIHGSNHLDDDFSILKLQID